MIRLFTVTSAIALAATAPAFAQQTGPTTGPETTGPATPGSTTGAQTEAPPELQDPASTTEAPMDQPSAPDASAAPATADDATSATPQPNANSATATPSAVDQRTAAVTQIVETEFANYDGDKDGALTQPEFAKWIMALQAKAVEAKAATAMDGAAQVTWVKNAFATADTDKSKNVSKTEMNTFLLG